MKTSQKGFVTPLLLAIIAILLIGGGIYVYMQTKQANQPITATSSAQDMNPQTADWKTYSNTKYGFEVKYPTNYQVNSVKTEGTPHPDSISFTLASRPTRGPAGAYILIPLPLNDELAHSNPDAQSLDDYKKDYTTNDGRNVIINDQKEMLVNGIRALRQVYSDANPIGDFNNAHLNLRYVFYDEKQFIIIDGGEGGGINSASDDKVLDQIASTFKFIP